MSSNVQAINGRFVVNSDGPKQVVLEVIGTHHGSKRTTLIRLTPAQVIELTRALEEESASDADWIRPRRDRGAEDQKRIYGT